MAAQVFKIAIDLKTLQGLKVALDQVGTDFGKDMQKEVKKLEGPIDKVASKLSKGLSKGLGILKDMVAKSKTLWLSLLGAATASFALASGSLDRRRESAIWGASKGDTEAVKFADKMSGLDFSSSINGVAGLVQEDWYKINALSGGKLKRSNNSITDAMEMMDFVMKEFKGLSDDAAMVKAKEFEPMLTALGLTGEEVRRLTKEGKIWSDFKKYYAEDSARNRGKDYSTLEKGEQAMHRFTEAWKDLLTEAAIVVLPTLTNFLNAISDGVKKLVMHVRKDKGVLSQAIGLAKQLLGFVGYAFDNIVELLGKIVNSKAFAQLLDTLGLGLDWLKGGIEGIKGIYHTGVGAYHELTGDREASDSHAAQAMGYYNAGNKIITDSSKDYINKTKDRWGIQLKTDPIQIKIDNRSGLAVDAPGQVALGAKTR